MGTSRGVQAQEVDAGYDRGYGMLDIKINLIFCNLVDFMNFAVGFFFIEEEFLHVHVHVRMVIMYCRPKSNDEEDDTK